MQKWAGLILRLVIAFLFFLGAIRWQGIQPNAYTALSYLAASAWASLAFIYFRESK